MKDAKNKAIGMKKEYSFHDLRNDTHRSAEYAEVRSSLKKSYGKKSNRTVRDMAQNLKPNTSEAIPAKGGYYSRSK